PPVVVPQVLDILGAKFGYEKNSLGYKVLNPKVRVIQGDGLDYEMIKRVLENMKNTGWSADNIVFGMGGGLLQKIDRGTQKFAFKCSSVVVNGEERDVYKKPVTDDAKISKRGRLALVKNLDPQRPFKTIDAKVALQDQLVTVFEDGQILRHYTLDD